MDIPDDDPIAVKGMLEFFYLASYIHDTDNPQWSLHAKIATLADKYHVNALKSLAHKLLKKSNAAVLNYEMDFAAAVKWTYENTGPDD